MGDALLFFRTSGTPKTGLGAIPNPDNLPIGQKLQFTLPEELLESVSLVYENNIKDAPVSNPEGKRKVNKQDNGLQGLTLYFKGRFRDASTDIAKIQNFAKDLQVEGQYHQYGKFGFKASNTVSTPFNFDPDKEFGLAIRKLEISRVGGRPKNFDFTLELTSGGTLI